MTDLAMTDLARPSQRQADQLRDVKITRDYTMHAEGSVLVEFGNTKVLCTASVEQGVPRFLKGSGKGWVFDRPCITGHCRYEATGREHD